MPLVDAYPPLPDGTPAPLLPTDVEPLNDADIQHIVWEHAWGFGQPGKTLFPPGWSRDVIQAAVETALWSEGVSRSLIRISAGVILRALVDDVIIELPLDELDHSWVLMTAFPVCGVGVSRHVGGGHREAVPLNIERLTRIL